MWADSGDTDFSSGGANQFAVRATGGISLVTGVDVSGNPVSGVIINDDSLETTVTLPFAFEATPNVIATPRSDPLSNTNDTFVVTVRKSATTYFVVNVYRVDVAGGSWSQNLLLDWMAWH